MVPFRNLFSEDESPMNFFFGDIRRVVIYYPPTYLKSFSIKYRIRMSAIDIIPHRVGPPALGQK